MSVYPAPPNQNGQIFNPSLWIIDETTGITTAFLDANYIQYPVAQGNCNFSGINNVGLETIAQTLTANGNIVVGGVALTNYIEFPDGTKQYTAGGSPDDLTAVLTAGNNAGGLNIANLNNINLTTINSAPYPPTAPPDNLTDVLTAGDNAGGLNIANLNNLDVITINSAPYPPISTISALSQVLLAGNSAGSTTINMNNNAITAVSSLGFATTSQTSAYTGGVAGTYTNTNMTIDANGKISSISNGSSGGTTQSTIASSSSYDAGTNTTSWNFTTYPSWSAYTWIMTTPTASKTNVVKSGLGSSPPLNVGTISANGSFVLMTGTGINQIYTATSSTMITYCAGFQQNYTISANANSAQLSVVNCIGATPSTPVFQSNQLSENGGTCPPTANALSGYIILKALNNLTGLGNPTLKFTQLLA